MYEIGKIYQISIKAQQNMKLGEEVLDLLKSYYTLSTTVRSFLASVPAVSMIIGEYSGSGAATFHRSAKIKVSESLPGGVDEIAESALFELCNWAQGDFAGGFKEQVKTGVLTPFRGGLKTAACEANSVFRHGQLLQQLKSNGFIFSVYGEKQRKETLNRTLDKIQSNMLLSSHDEKAISTDSTSLYSPFMYWYDFMNDIADAEITIRAINNPDEWLKKCIEKAWEYNDFLRDRGAEPANLFVKLINLAKLYGFNIRGGYEFTPAMKIVAKETTAVPSGLQMSLKGMPTDKSMPNDLIGKFKLAHLLA